MCSAKVTPQPAFRLKTTWPLRQLPRLTQQLLTPKPLPQPPLPQRWSQPNLRQLHLQQQIRPHHNPQPLRRQPTPNGAVACVIGNQDGRFRVSVFLLCNARP